MSARGAKLSALLLSLSLFPIPAMADDAETEARKRFSIARRHHELGRFEAAIDEYQLVYELRPVPDILFNIAQCHRNLGDLERAIFFFEKYAADDDARDVERVESLIAELESQLAARKAEEAEAAPPEPAAVEDAVSETATASVVVAPPPPPLPEPQPIAAPEPPVLVPPPEEPSTSVVDQWWFWTAIGVAAVAAGGTIAAVAATSDSPEGSLATIRAR